MIIADATINNLENVLIYNSYSSFSKICRKKCKIISMKLIRPRKNLQQAIPLMALMAAINVIVSELASLSPILSIFLILCLPLTSALVELCCKDRYFPIYALSTLGLSIALTFWNIDVAIFYVLPAIVTGYIFGLMAKLKIPAFWSIFAATLAQTAISFALIPFINFVFQVDIILTFKTAFGVASLAGADIIVPTFIFAISLLQISLSHLIVSNELPKFGISYIENELSQFVAFVTGVVFGAVVWGLYFWRLDLAYLSLAVSIYFACYSVGMFILKREFIAIIASAIVMVANVFLFAGVQGFLVEYSQLLLLSFASVLICLLSCLFSFLRKEKEKIK